MQRMLSGKQYWVIVIVGLFVSISLIGFVLVPFAVFDYDLGTNLISEIVGILLTIVFLTWLFNLREKIQWKSVKDNVMKNIAKHSTDLCSHFAMVIEFSESADSLFGFEGFVSRLSEIDSARAR